MKSFETDIKKYTEKIRLKASERSELRARVFSYMEYHPLPKQSIHSETFAREMISSESFITLHFNAFYARIAGGVAVLLLIMAPFVAEKSVPGDVLYLIKTGINEPFQGQLVNSPYEKIEFETKLMERRIAEARVLATEGKLTEEVKTQIAETVKEHTTAVQQGIAELREHDEDGAVLATIAFNSSLEVQTAMLEATAENTATSTTPVIDPILTVVNEAQQENASTQEGSTPSYDGLVAQIELETTRAMELFAAAKVSATTEEVTDIERRLSDIDRLTVEAKDLYAVNPEQAATDLAEILGLVQKLIAFMSDIEIREVVALENLVPVVLSDDERIAFVKEEIEILKTVHAPEMRSRLEAITDRELLSKVEEGLATVDEDVTKAAVALEVSDIALAENAVREARALITDIDAMTQTEAVEVPVVESEEVAPEGGEEGTTTPEVSEEGAAE